MINILFTFKCSCITCDKKNKIVDMPKWAMRLDSLYILVYWTKIK